MPAGEVRLRIGKLETIRSKSAGRRIPYVAPLQRVEKLPYTEIPAMHGNALRIDYKALEQVCLDAGIYPYCFHAGRVPGVFQPIPVARHATAEMVLTFTNARDHVAPGSTERAVLTWLAFWLVLARSRFGDRAGFTLEYEGKWFDWFALPSSTREVKLGERGTET